jgi:hypothetical protein
MFKQIKPIQVERFVGGGLVEGNTRYHKLSGEYVTDRGVESFLAYFVAQRFKRFFSPKKTCIRLEVSQSQLEKYYIGATKLSRRFSQRGRFDIVVLGKAGEDGLDLSAIGIIELKREQGYPGGYKKDIKRLASIVRDCRTNEKFQFGCFAGVQCEEQGTKHGEQIKKERSLWTSFMQRTADQMDIQVKPFSPLNDRFKPDKINDNGKPYSSKWRIDVIGCVFYR